MFGYTYKKTGIWQLPNVSSAFQLIFDNSVTKIGTFVTRRQNRYMLWDFIVILRWIKTLFIIITCILRKSTWEKMQNDNSSCKVETKDASMIPFHREEGFRYQRCLQYGNLGELT